MALASISFASPGDREPVPAAERVQEGSADESAARRSWQDPSSRVAAAAALRDLYDRGTVSARVDRAALEDARARLGPDFLLTETRNFVILSDADQPWTRQRGAMLERTRHQYFRAMDRLGAPVYPHEYKLLCILFKDFSRYQTFASSEDGMEAAWVAGYYSPRANRIVFYNDSNSPAFDRAAAVIDAAVGQVKELRADALRARREGRTRYAESVEASAAELEGRVRAERERLSRTAAGTTAAKTVHEAVHLLSFNTGLQSPEHEYPFWLTEGLASCFETDDPAMGAFGPDHALGARREALARARSDNKLLPLDRLVELTDVPESTGHGGPDADTAQVMYDQSQALFAYLYRYRRRELATYIGSIAAEPPGHQKPGRQKALFGAAFGDPKALERRLNPN